MGADRRICFSDLQACPTESRSLGTLIPFFASHRVYWCFQCRLVGYWDSSSLWWLTQATRGSTTLTTDIFVLQCFRISTTLVQVGKRSVRYHSYGWPYVSGFSYQRWILSLYGSSQSGISVRSSGGCSRHLSDKFMKSSSLGRMFQHVQIYVCLH